MDVFFEVIVVGGVFVEVYEVGDIFGFEWVVIGFLCELFDDVFGVMDFVVC